MILKLYYQLKTVHYHPEEIVLLLAQSADNISRMALLDMFYSPSNFLLITKT